MRSDKPQCFQEKQNSFKVKFPRSCDLEGGDFHTPGKFADMPRATSSLTSPYTSYSSYTAIFNQLLMLFNSLIFYKFQQLA